MDNDHASLLATETQPLKSLSHVDGQIKVALSLLIAWAAFSILLSLIKPAFGQSDGYAIEFSKTVGLEEGECAKSPVLVVARGTRVFYCFRVANSGTKTMTLHTVIDDRLGTLALERPFILAPGGLGQLIESAMITETVHNIATWQALDEQGAIQAVGRDAAKVYVEPPIELDAGISIDRASCAGDGQLIIEADEQIYFCHRLHNRSDMTLTQHTLIDHTIGRIVDNVTYPLGPGESVTTDKLGVALSDIVATSTAHPLTWIVSATHVSLGLGPEELPPPEELPQPLVMSTTAVAEVLVPGLQVTYTVGIEPDACAATSELTVFSGTTIYFCYFATNTGGITFTHHTLIQNFLEQEYSVVRTTPFEMKPQRLGGTGGILFNSQVATTSTASAITTASVMTWTAYTSMPTSRGAQHSPAVIQPATSQPATSLDIPSREGLNHELASSALSTSCYRLACFTVELPTRLLTISAHAQVSITILPLAQAQIILFEDFNGNGTQDVGEPGIPNATVQLQSATEIPSAQLTDQFGAAQFRQLSPGIYELEITFQQPLQNFQPVGVVANRLLLRSGEQTIIPIGHQRIGNPPQHIYVPIRLDIASQ